MTDMKMSEENEQAMVLGQLDSVADTAETDAMPNDTNKYCSYNSTTSIYHDTVR
ncbi:hypothetical protein [Schleiferilactobacillus harbinensis]|uniref:hypothetical protein n=1 Tax=Schleiferilactobacillus harbinensis TaxID=304207 RepID=UPI0039EBCA6B